MDTTIEVKPAERSSFAGRRTYYSEYGAALRLHYPEVAAGWLEERSAATPIRGERPSQRAVASLAPGVDKPVFAGRLQDPDKRSWRRDWPAYRRSRRWSSAGYKGLLCMKAPTDLMLYSHLIWELQPRTIIEFGSLQGGSGLWFADQLAATLRHGEGRVYSFDYLTKCVHPVARQHPGLMFLTVNLRELETLDTELLRTAPHPWLVTEDAHVNVFGLFSFLDPYLASGDYYVIEDAFIDQCRQPPDEKFLANYRRIGKLGYLVDSLYADAFGYNATCAPNAWLRKS